MENTANQSSIQIYLTNKNRFGSFWGLYMVGITNLFDLKYTIGQLFVSLCMQFLITYYTNQIVTNKQLNENIMTNLIIVCFIKIILTIVSYWFTRKINVECRRISQKISTYVEKLYFHASNTWKSTNTDTAQKESIRELFFAYDNTSSMISRTLQMTIESSVTLIIASMNDLSIGLTIIIGSFILFKIKKYLNIELSNTDKKMADTMTEIQLLTSNQFTNRNDKLYSPKYETLLSPDQYDPINGMTKNCQVWNDRNLFSKQTNTVINIMKPMIIIILACYLQSIQKIELIIFVVVNHNKLFGFINVITQLDEVKDLSGSRIASSFKMLDHIISTDHMIKIGGKKMVDRIYSIQIHDIIRYITNEIKLIYRGIITIYLNRKGIILLNGPKGSGKSITMDILAGLYDGNVTDSTYINGIKVDDEFRSIQCHRTYVRQCVADDYKSNKKNTVYMSLFELFPRGEYDEIKNFLTHFDMSHKIPDCIDKPISLNERGLSPGEIQSIVLASQIWKALQLKSSLLLLDEPERNIDFDTVKKIFNMLNNVYDGTIILITHLPDLKTYLEKNIKEIWNYEPNNGEGTLSFMVEKK